MSTPYNYLLGLNGGFPASSHRIVFSDTWQGHTISNEVIWDGVTKPVTDQLSWNTWIVSNGYGAHPQGAHAITVTAYDVSNVQVGQWHLNQTVQSVGTFTLQSNFTTGTGAPYDKLEFPLGWSGTYYPLQWPAATYRVSGPWLPPPSGYLIISPPTFLNNVTMTFVTDEPAHIGEVPTWTYIPFYDIGSNLIDNIPSVDPATTLGAHTLTISGLDTQGQTFSLPITLNIYDTYRWYMSYLNYTWYYAAGGYETYPLVDYECVLAHDIVSWSGIGGANMFSVTALPPGWTAVDESMNDLTTVSHPVGSAGNSLQVLAHLSSPGVPGSYPVTFTLSNNSAVEEDRVVSIPVVDPTIIYPGVQPVLGEFHFSVNIDSGSEPFLAHLAMDQMTNFPQWNFVLVSTGDSLVLHNDLNIGGTLYPAVFTGPTVGVPGPWEIVATWDNTVMLGTHSHNLIVIPEGDVTGVVRIIQVDVVVPE